MQIGCNKIDEHECCLYNTNICIRMLATKQFPSALLFYGIISISKVSHKHNYCVLPERTVIYNLAAHLNEIAYSE